MNDLYTPSRAILEFVTIQDCIDMKEKKGYTVYISAGEVLGFEREDEEWIEK